MTFDNLPAVDVSSIQTKIQASPGYQAKMNPSIWVNYGFWVNNDNLDTQASFPNQFGA